MNPDPIDIICNTPIASLQSGKVRQAELDAVLRCQKNAKNVGLNSMELGMNAASGNPIAWDMS